ncbi:MAG: c-type cytochrome domain-containing protein, partial [Armatimonadaceae bacterium]
MNSRVRNTLGLALSAVALAGSWASGWAAPPKKVASKAAAGATVDFNRDIRPILSENCFLCHGPDANTRQAGLRLDDRLVAVTRKAIVPGKPEASELLRRVRSTNMAIVMPPGEQHKRLSGAQIAVLERWIRQGAQYRRHWSFEPLPRVVPVPKVAGARTPIDAF